MECAHTYDTSTHTLKRWYALAQKYINSISSFLLLSVGFPKLATANEMELELFSFKTINALYSWISMWLSVFLIYQLDHTVVGCCCCLYVFCWNSVHMLNFHVLIAVSFNFVDWTVRLGYCLLCAFVFHFFFFHFDDTHRKYIE